MPSTSALGDATVTGGEFVDIYSRRRPELVNPYDDGYSPADVHA